MFTPTALFAKSNKDTKKFNMSAIAKMPDSEKIRKKMLCTGCTKRRPKEYLVKYSSMCSVFVL